MLVNKGVVCLQLLVSKGVVCSQMLVNKEAVSLHMLVKKGVVCLCMYVGKQESCLCSQLCVQFLYNFIGNQFQRSSIKKVDLTTSTLLSRAHKS